MVTLAGNAACYNPSPAAGAPCGPAGECPSGLSCIDQVCVAGGGSPDGGNQCAATAECSGDQLIGCGAPRVCPDGCSTSGGAHCKRIIPSNGLDWNWVPAPDGGVLELASGEHLFDTTTGELVSMNATVDLAALRVANLVVPITSGELRVLAMTGLIIRGGATLRVIGDRPLAMLVDGDAQIESGGTISLAGGCATMQGSSCAGAGGGAGATIGNQPAGGCGGGDSGKESAINDPVGGGGGGFGGPGGQSPGNAVLPAARGGASCGAPSLEPLIGGSGGGAGAVEGVAVNGGTGGGGGGALQLTVAGLLVIDGAIDAGGAGGATGDSLNRSGGGGGGGSGGALLLEAREGSATGTITANGGGGGGNLGAMSGNGSQALIGVQCAVGGVGDPPDGRGGSGGCLATAAGAAAPNVSEATPGGGGGGVGRIRINLRARSSFAPIVSPNDTGNTPGLQ